MRPPFRSTLCCLDRNYAVELAVSVHEYQQVGRSRPQLCCTGLRYRLGLWYAMHDPWIRPQDPLEEATEPDGLYGRIKITRQAGRLTGQVFHYRRLSWRWVAPRAITAPYGGEQGNGYLWYSFLYMDDIHSWIILTEGLKYLAKHFGRYSLVFFSHG